MNENNLLRTSKIEQSYNLLQEAYIANSERNSRKKANDALKLYPQNIDAKLFLLSFEKNFINKLEKNKHSIRRRNKKVRK